MSDIVVLSAVVGGLLGSALVTIWFTPHSAKYVGNCLLRRAEALNAARSAYREAWKSKPHPANCAKWFGGACDC